MALAFVEDGDVLRIDQTRRGLKILVWVIYFGMISGYVQAIVGYAKGQLPLVALIVAPVGMLVLVAVCGMFLVESHVVVDRKARTIAMRGYRWPLKRWKIERSLDDIESVGMQQVYVGRGQRDRRIFVTFKDGTRYRAFSPAAAMVATIEQRYATLKAYCGG